MNDLHRSHGMTFLFSDLEPLPDRFFQGHAFVGRDYLFGQQGALDYEDARGAPVPAGEDGCYVTVARRGGVHRIGVDYNGSKKLFYFRQGGAWCVSNSLPLIAEHMRERGIRLTVNFGQLAAFKGSGTFASQQAATTSIFNEVKLLPTTWRVTVTRAGLHVHQHPFAAGSALSYPDALGRYLSTWVSRVQTLMRDDRTWLNVDLSGGVDSRTVFSLISAARQSVGDGAVEHRVSLRSSTSPRQANDLLVATDIASRFGWDINGPAAGRPALPKLTNEERYMGWRDLCLGVYTSVYFPDRHVNPMVIDFHGAGGGHRPSYPGTRVAEQLDKVRGVGPSYLIDAWKASVASEEEILTQAWPGSPPLMSHYHEYRNRFHSGLLPQYRTVFAPLGSLYIAAMSNHPEKVKSGQILFDIMESLTPGLKDISYITASRSPSPENLARMTVSGSAVDATAGVAFGSLDDRLGEVRRKPSGHLELMGKDLERATSSNVKEFLGDEVVYNAHKAMADAISDVRFAVPSDGKDVSRVLATGFAFSAAGF